MVFCADSRNCACAILMYIRRTKTSKKNTQQFYRHSKNSSFVESIKSISKESNQLRTLLCIICRGFIVASIRAHCAQAITAPRDLSFAGVWLLRLNGFAFVAMKSNFICCIHCYLNETWWDYAVEMAKQLPKIHQRKKRTIWNGIRFEKKCAVHEAIDFWRKTSEA